MDNLLKYLDARDYCSIRAMDRCGNIISILTKDRKLGDCKFAQSFMVMRDKMFPETFSTASEAADAFVNHCGDRVVAYTRGYNKDITLYKHDIDNKYHCDKACPSSTRHSLEHMESYSTYNIQIHMVYQLIQAGMICRDCYDSSDSEPSLKCLYDLWRGVKQQLDSRKYGVNKNMLKAHFDVNNVSLRAVDNTGHVACELIMVREFDEVIWSVGRWNDDVGYDDYKNIDDAIEAFVKEMKKSNIVALDDGESPKLTFGSDYFFHCSEECGIVTADQHKEHHKSHDMPMHMTFCLVDINYICSKCYDMRSGGRSVKYLYDLWETVKILVRH